MSHFKNITRRQFLQQAMGLVSCAASMTDPESFNEFLGIKSQSIISQQKKECITFAHKCLQSESDYGADKTHHKKLNKLIDDSLKNIKFSSRPSKKDIRHTLENIESVLEENNFVYTQVNLLWHTLAPTKLNDEIRQFYKKEDIGNLRKEDICCSAYSKETRKFVVDKYKTRQKIKENIDGEFHLFDCKTKSIIMQSILSLAGIKTAMVPAIDHLFIRCYTDNDYINYETTANQERSNRSYIEEGIHPVSIKKRVYLFDLDKKEMDALRDFNIATHLYDRGDYDLALEKYAKSQQNNSKDPSSKYNTGLCFKKRGLNSAALKFFEEVISLDPNYYSAYFEKGNIQMINGDLENGLKNLKISRELKEKRANDDEKLYICNLARIK